MRAVLCALFLAVLVTVLPDRGNASFVVSPMELHLRVGAAQRGGSVILIRNTGQRALALKLYLADSRFGNDGTEEEVPLGSLERSCAFWTTLGTELIDLAPGEMRRVTIDLSPPAEARGSYWTKLYIEEVSTPEPTRREENGRSYQVYMRQRMGVRIFESVPGTEQPGAVVDRVLVATEGEGRKVTVSVQNTGNSLLRCQGKVEVRDSRGEVVETLLPGTKGEFLLFPGGNRELPVQLRLPLPEGSYSVLAVVDYGAENLVAGEEVFQVTKHARGARRPGVASKQGRR